MNGETETIFLLLWIGFLMLGVGSAFAFIWWGVRNGQFSNQDRARYLPLRDENDEVQEDEPNEKELNNDEHEQHRI